ncbi:MAG TPA: lycopene cyclase domain-containing protein, partial [Saprospiraceae bacterium]|nr:lycopene cyclase domain-containing protein [Saprospiraceae bacterium]
QWILKCRWLGTAYIVYLILILPFLVVNGILTGTGLDEPIVWYNNAENLNLRLLSIPVEDFFYGFFLFLLTAFFFERGRSRVLKI